ncbi:Uncharacterized protein BM_BM10063 [Brugia malayi]|uniref:acid phosphatase n=2 Tax=Brugia malayi TaxID=6279 RepID=A0A4E9FHI3_BRUMA|nr:Uncharacterized protein BM_BM10063 [Brugia malayi]VIO94300.1 Uncharacterized protein BM_BM10063 [Brugia malayi]
MSMPTDPVVSNNEKLPHEDNDNNGIFGRIINKSKVYPLEEYTHSEIRNDHVNEKVLPVELEESRKIVTVPKQQKSLFRRNFKETLILSAAISTIALSFVGVTVYYILSYSRPELVYTNMIWRHGDRAPAHYFPNFTEKYMIAFPRGMGNLTKIGAEQAEQLGLLLQRRYINPGNITSKQIYIRSTDVHRTIETAQHVLKGMSFPDTRINVELTTNVDTAGNPFFDCPVATQFVLDQEEKYFLRENFSEIYELMQQELNYNSYSYYLFDTLNCLKAHDLALPNWLRSDELYEKLKFLSWYGVEAQFGIGPYDNKLQRKIRGGSSLRGVVSRIACKVNYSEWSSVDSCEEKFYGLSAHDMTIAALLSTFSDIHSILGKSPLIGYGANIAFEIWRIDNLYKMKIMYANQWDANPQDITQFAPGCEDSIKFCNVTKFIEHSRELFFDNVQEACLKGSENLISHVIRRSTNTDEVIDLIQMY